MPYPNFGYILEKVFDTDSALYQCLVYYIMCRKGVYYNKVFCEYNNSYDDYIDELNTLYCNDKTLFNFDLDVKGNESIMYNDFIKYDCSIGQVNFIDWLFTTGVLEHVYDIRVELVEELVEEGLIRGTPKILYELNNKITNCVNKFNTLKMNSDNTINDTVDDTVDDTIDDTVDDTTELEDNISIDDMVEVDISNICENTAYVNNEEYTDEEKDKLIDGIELEDTVDMCIGSGYTDNCDGECNCEYEYDEYVDGENDEINYEFNKMMNSNMSENEESNFNEAEFMSVLNETLQKIQEKYGTDQPLGDTDETPNPDKMNDIMKVFMDVLINRSQLNQQQEQLQEQSQEQSQSDTMSNSDDTDENLLNEVD